MKTSLVKIAVLAAVLAAAGGCREQEVGRPLSHEKGVYTGKKDEPLSDEARRALRNRIQVQSGGNL